MHQLFTVRIRSVIVAVAIFGLLLYCLRNFVWNEPQFDFRPFKVGVNVAEKKAAEEESEAARRILTWKLKNNADGRVVELSDEVYMKEFKSYPKEEWTFLGNTMTEPTVPHSKISDFQIIDLDGSDVTADILENPDPILFVVAYKLKGETSFVQEPVRDSIYQIDTIRLEDSVIVVRRLANVAERMETKAHYTWDKEYLAKWTELVKPLSEAAAKEGIATYAVAGGAAEEAILSFKQAIGVDIPIYEADEIMLKTIARSNPGLLLMKNGVILGKWHYRHFPDVATLKNLATQ